MSPSRSDVVERIGWSVPERYRSCRFDTFDAYTPDLAERVEIVKAAARKGQSLLLSGPCGSGKTHLSVAVMADWLARGLCGSFIGAMEFVYRSQAAFGNAAAVANELIGEDDVFVLVDDIGVERTTDAAKSAMLYLVDRVYRNRLRLIATSNLAPADLSRYEPRLMSRIAEIALVVGIRADDFRLRTARSRKSVRVLATSAQVIVRTKS